MLLRAAAVVVMACAHVAHAAAQDTPPAPPSSSSSDRASGTTRFDIANLTRAELWRYFQPLPGGGTEPDYAFIGNRSTLGVHYDGPRWALHGAIQYVRLENLPRGAIGPGLLGNGGAYFFQAAGTFSYQFYLRGLSATFQAPARGLSLEVGRFAFTPDGDRPPADPADALAHERLAGRMLGDMDDTLYQRAWDGARLQVNRGDWQWTAAAVLPTQGTFEESANLPLDRVRVVSAEVSAGPGAFVDHTRVQAFAYGYRDTREVRARPDNSGRTAPAAEVTIGTLGAAVAGVYPRGAGAWDGVAWAAAQAGDWYGQPHRAFSALAEGGYQWTRARGRPWLRAGAVYASGDGDADDERHGTFFPMLPGADRFVRSNVYALMNAVDVWAEVRVEPHARLQAQVALHRVALASDADRWYAGSGATERRGNYFGYLGRNTRGQTTLGTLVEGETRLQLTRWWNVRLYVARFAGGDAVRAAFQDDRLFTGVVESLIRF